MKILRPLLILAAGFILGWAVSNTISHRTREKCKSALDPASINALKESVASQKPLTNGEMEQLRQYIRDYGQQTVKEFQMMALWQGILAIQIQRALYAGDTNQVDIVLTRAISHFQEKHKEGIFKGTEQEKIADAWSEANALAPAKSQ